MFRLVVVSLLALSVTGSAVYFALREDRAEHTTAGAEQPPVLPQDGGRGGGANSSGTNKPDDANKPATGDGGGSAKPASDPAFEAPSTDSTSPGRIEPDLLASSDYAQYDREVLEQLVRSGDATAMQVLGLRLLKNGDSDRDRRSAENLLEGAVIHGARHYPFKALGAMASSDLRRAAKGEVEMTGEEKRQARIETFAYYELAAMRGNRALKESMRRAFADRYGIEPSADEWEAIKSEAGTRYKELQKYRQQLGLGPFGDPVDVE